MDMQTLFCAGDRAVLVGLQDAALNGQIGKVLRFDSKTSRFAGRVGVKTLAVKPANLLSKSKNNMSSLKLCRYGGRCRRPNCHFHHEDRAGRASLSAAHWQALCEGERMELESAGGSCCTGSSSVSNESQNVEQPDPMNPCRQTSGLATDDGAMLVTLNDDVALHERS